MGNKQAQMPKEASQNVLPASKPGAMAESVSKINLPFSTVLIANRGEIALRLIRAVQSLGLRAVAVFVADDSSSPHLIPADIVVPLGSDHSLYSNPEALLEAAKKSNADAVLPGYGFVSENPQAATLFEQNGMIWVGPTAETIETFGLKHTARKAAKDADVPIVPGTSVLKNAEQALAEVEKVGLPALVKASAGGGGMGQAIVKNRQHMERAFAAVETQAQSLFATSDIYLERYVESARHVEVQIFGDGKGNCVALGDRDCSVQRRRQKVIEEGCAPNLPEEVRRTLRLAAARLCAQHKYRSAGTVEFILDAETYDWYFLEVNTRLQVEHGVTELVSGIDIVQWMLLQAGGVDVLKDGKVSFDESGVAIEVRIYAENPVKDYVPCPGTLSEMIWPEETVCKETGSRVRIDAWAQRGTVVPPHYDPLLGKVLVWARTRPLAIVELNKALDKTVVRGVASNIELLRQVTNHTDFLQGDYTTELLNSLIPQTRSIEVLKPGLQTSLQDYPGRIGYWNIGVSPSGPMDAYAMGVANALVGNPAGACALEITMSGPTLLFHITAVIAITGGSFHAELDDGKIVEQWIPVEIPAGSILTIGQALGRNEVSNGSVAGGCMAYLAIRNGFDVPKYLGSASTFPTGKFGGLTGSFLSAGDFLPIGDDSQPELGIAEKNGLDFRWPVGKKLPSEFIPSYDNDEWTVAALNGPHASVDFLEEESITKLWSTAYTMHHAKNRLGARLIGPAPKWTRADGGSAGLHPSNLHDYTYAPGAVNLSGNTPIVLMLDGPSLGGFVCPITVASAELWKVAQVKAGEKVRFKQVDVDDANMAMEGMEQVWEGIRLNDEKGMEAATWRPNWIDKCDAKKVGAILEELKPEKDGVEMRVVYRMSGDEHVLIEYGEIELNLGYRMRVHMLMEGLQEREYIRELCPGVRSLLVRYDRKKMHVKKLLQILIELEKEGTGNEGVEQVKVASRVLHLPLAFADKWTAEAQERYVRSIRPDAPYMPSNVEFVRRINGLSSVEEVKKIMTSAEYMVLGLGDVYLGAPCAVPVDPRHRLVTSKYNPARTYTPEGAVGIGGAYMCIYGMDSPGGYQLCGRTLPIWDNYGNIAEKNRGAKREIPWLLRFFDRVKFFPVSDEQLEHMREEYRKGRYSIDIQEQLFSYADHISFLKANQGSIESFETRREQAYSQERQRWQAKGEGESNAAAEHATAKPTQQQQQTPPTPTAPKQPGSFYTSVHAGLAASVWNIHVKDGDQVEKGQPLLTLESMKVEIEVQAPGAGTVTNLTAQRGDHIRPQQQLCQIYCTPSTTRLQLDMSSLRQLYTSGQTSPSAVLSQSAHSCKSAPSLYTSVVTAVPVHVPFRTNSQPLCGIPFTICNALHKASALVQSLQKAGAVLVAHTVSPTAQTLNLSYTGLEAQAPLQNPVNESVIAGGNAAAATAIKDQHVSFAVVLDRHGTSLTSPSLCDIWGLKTAHTPTVSDTAGCAMDRATIYTNANAPNDMRRILSVISPEHVSHNNNNNVTVLYLQDVDNTCYNQVIDKLSQAPLRLVAHKLQPFDEMAHLLDDVPLHYATLPELHKQAMHPQVHHSVRAWFEKVESLPITTFAAAVTKMDTIKKQVHALPADAFILPVDTDVSASLGVDGAQPIISRYARIFTLLDLCCLSLRGALIVAPSSNHRTLLHIVKHM